MNKLDFDTLFMKAKNIAKTEERLFRLFHETHLKPISPNSR
jgi:hypothetical protein